MLLMRIERATPGDLPGIEALLGAARLPVDRVTAALRTGVVARDGDRLIGAAAVEPYGDAALLRSVVVAPGDRSSGVGRALVAAAAEAVAAATGARSVYLLTETARDWFSRLGYDTIDRRRVAGAVATSAEFTSACPAGATVMVRELRGRRPVAGTTPGAAPRSSRQGATGPADARASAPRRRRRGPQARASHSAMSPADGTRPTLTTFPSMTRPGVERTPRAMISP
jgi:amino-acid N-acetyltransferase